MLSLGTIEVVGLPAAIEAADVALKAANVELIGYETTDGMGMVAVKVVGQIGAVKAAMAAAEVAAGRINKVFSVSVIARPNDQIAPVVYTPVTVGRPGPTPVTAPAEPTPPPAAEPADTTATQPAEPPTPPPGTEPAPTEPTPSPVESGPDPEAPPEATGEPIAGEHAPTKRTRPARAKATTVRSE